MIKFGSEDLTYKIDSLGTEQILPDNSSSITTCSPTLDIKYGEVLKQNQNFMYRQTGGGDSNIVSTNALFKKLLGKSVVWNQLVTNGDFSNGTTGWSADGATLSAENGVLTWTATDSTPSSNINQAIGFVNGHKYYISFLIKGNASNRVSGAFGSASGGGTFSEASYSTSWLRVSRIGSPTNNSSVNLYIRPNGDGSDNFIAYFKDIHVIDLTLMFGAGNEPSTVAEFELWLSQNVGLKSYYPYNKGQLISVNTTSIKTVGFNQFNGEYEDGAINTTTGENIVNNITKRCVGFIPVLSNTNYYCQIVSGTSESMWMAFYDANKNIISEGLPNISDVVNVRDVDNEIFTMPSNCAFVRFYVKRDSDCILNISNSDRNGTYEAYWSRTKSIDPTKIYGRVNGQGNIVQLFPDGMRSAGSIYDEIDFENRKAIKRVGTVDLGTLSWNYASEVSNFSSTAISNRHSGRNMICQKYSNKETAGISDLADKQMLGYASSVEIVIKDTSYSDATTFKTALNGVMLNYELETPIEYTDLMYSPSGSGNDLILFGNVDLKNRYIGENKVGRVYIGSNKIWETSDWYGIRWAESTNTVERIGNPTLHQTLPIQSQMRRCILQDDGTVYKYISSSNPFEYEDGTTAHYDGSDGQVMVEIPAYHHECGTETIDGVQYNYIKLYPDVSLGITSKKCYIGAFELVQNSSDNSSAKGCSVSVLDLSAMQVTTSTTSINASDVQYLSNASTYRNYNYSNTDTTSVKCSYGRPTTNINRATFRNICARRGTNWSQQSWDAYNSLLRLYFVEYAKFDSQAAFNSALTEDGYKQGGLGTGVTNADSTDWSNFNGYNPFVPCGLTIHLGNDSGVVSYVFATDEWKSGASYTTYVNSYRGIELPFGHVWKFIDGLNRQGGLDENQNTIEKIYICNDVTKFAEDAANGYTLTSQSAPRATGNVGGIVLDEQGTFWPKPGGSTIYGDYFYNDYSNGSWYTLYAGGSAASGSSAGLLYFRAHLGAGYAYAYVGSRLLYTNRD